LLLCCVKELVVVVVPTLSFASTSTFVDAATTVDAWFISLVFCSNVFAAITF
jgi:hypothetical protein